MSVACLIIAALVILYQEAGSRWALVWQGIIVAMLLTASVCFRVLS